MHWIWWVLILFWTGGFAWAADNIRTALRNRHERKCQQYVGPQPLSQVYAEELTDLA
ncbi:hypothetical protein ACF065_18405 [Streptomyces sp. NPDC015232]|uniref:hypothetical protein n=1 Tax=unclassified Streptomyces TaxID=2593676 RepID=UPI0036FA97B2